MDETDYFGGYEFLLPSAVVNKHWSAIAVSELYYDPLDFVKLSSHEKISQNAFESFESGLVVTLEAETKAHATVIRTCPNINTISVYGWNDGALPELLDAIKEKRTLKKIVVSKYNMYDDESDIFCTSMEFLRMMVCWPLLEVVYCHSETLGWEEHDDELISNMRAMDVAHEAEMRQYESEEIAGISDEEKASRIEWFEKERKVQADAKRKALERTADFDVPSAHVNKNPNLRFFRWNEMPWNMDMYALEKLSAMAPNLQHFCTACAFNTSEDLRALIGALRSWKDTLQELHLGRHLGIRGSRGPWRGTSRASLATNLVDQPPIYESRDVGEIDRTVGIPQVQKSITERI
ncbi:hypothetical protein VNI00_003894 [Paramarasmius palmivorus]|uniref:Uncharacterized protein n=1 Tax=Paramarasmius palmivorus TaxID=297713 RepID=A0AAW0DRP1_9AGAR